MLAVQTVFQGTISTTIVLKDALILSFGDSFSAGEGNPEQPVAFVANSYSDYNASSRISGKVQYFPVREDISTLKPGDRKFFGDLAASWTNTQCHRSLYSQHTKAALLWALGQRHAGTGADPDVMVPQLRHASLPKNQAGTSFAGQRHGLTLFALEKLHASGQLQS